MNNAEKPKTNLDPRAFAECRTCHVWRCVHKAPQNEFHHATSCDEFVPPDNLEYLEYMENKNTIRKWYAQKTVEG